MNRTRLAWIVLALGSLAACDTHHPVAQASEPPVDNTMTRYVQTRVDDLQKAQVAADTANQHQHDADKQLQSADTTAP